MAEKKYGHFDDANREYVITDPKTPSPWPKSAPAAAFYNLHSSPL